MEDQKSCLFCGKGVDRTFVYCPHCGYEFGECDESPPIGAPQGSPPEEAVAAGCAGEERDYLVRLRTLQDILSDMEKELDVIIRTSSKDP
jgi:hypothetical protein